MISMVRPIYDEQEAIQEVFGRLIPLLNATGEEFEIVRSPARLSERTHRRSYSIIPLEIPVISWEESGIDIRTLIRSPGSHYTLALRALARRCWLPGGLIYLSLMWGDCIAAHLYPGLSAQWNNYEFRIAHFTVATCPPS